MTFFEAAAGTFAVAKDGKKDTAGHLFHCAAVHLP